MAQVITVGSGLGGFTAIAPQSGYGSTFTSPTRPIYGLKSNKATHDPHIVQGTGYLEYGRIVDIGAAHVQTYLDAKGTLVCDAFNSGLALMLAQSFGSAAVLVQNGSSALYELGGASGVRPEAPEAHNSETWSAANTYETLGQIVLEVNGKYYENIKADATNKNQKPSSAGTYWTVIPTYAAGTTYTAAQKVQYEVAAKNTIYTSLEAGNKGNTPSISPTQWQAAQSFSGSQLDMQLGVPTNQGELTPWNYHSCMITKAEFVFERTGLVSCTFDWDAQYVENSTALVTPTMSVSAAPFSMSNTASVFKIGAPGSQVTLPGVRKLTVTLQRKLAVDRVYLGEQRKQIPSTNGMLDLLVAAEMDYTNQAKGVLETFLTNTPQALTVNAVGPAVGTIGSEELGFEMSNGFIESGGEAPLDGMDIVKNTVNLKATINSANANPLKGILKTQDTVF